MPTDDFAFFTEEDKNSMAYKACVMGQAGIGAAFGSFAGGTLGVGVGSAPGAVLGGLVGLGIGLMTCPRLKDPIKRKLFSSNASLSEEELRAVLESVRQFQPKLTKAQAMNALAHVRVQAAQEPERFRTA